MKAYNRLRPAAIAALAAIVALTASCTEKPVAPTPAPTPQPAPAPPPPPPPPPPLPKSDVDWRTAPITPGDWQWSIEGELSVARFDGGTLVLACNRGAGKVSMSRRGTASGLVPMTILTSSGERSITATASAGPPPHVGTSFPARDSILDAMAFSRGRFAVETAGMPTLYVPSWPEVSRVIEDCR